MYISDSPCGDASIYEISPDYQSTNNSNEGLNFTGAKIIVQSESNENINVGVNPNPNFNQLSSETRTNKVVFAREKIQRTSALRLKSGRSNIPPHQRSLSMSCSDKICKWIVLGLQGNGMLSSLLNNPLRLSSIVVSRDLRVSKGSHSQFKSLERALIERTKEINRSYSRKFKKS